MNKIKRLLIGPLSIVAALFLIFYLYNKSPDVDRSPLHMRELQKVQTSLDINDPGMYNLFYLVPLDLSVNSNESDVRKSISSSDYYQNIAEKVGQTKITKTDEQAESALYQEHDGSDLVFKSGNPKI